MGFMGTRGKSRVAGYSTRCKVIYELTCTQLVVATPLHL